MIKMLKSGGQTGADYGGLLAGKWLGIPTGGWAAKGWLMESEDGSKHISGQLLLSSFGLKEYHKPDRDIPKIRFGKDWVDFFVKAYVYRTEANARDSDGTIWLGAGDSKGFAKTKSSCLKHDRPFFDATGFTASEVRKWIKVHDISVLNIAGNRESKRPEKYENYVFSQVVRDFLVKTLKGL